MKLDVTVELIELDGTPITDDKRICPTCRRAAGDGEPLTIRRACARALQFIPERTTVSYKDQKERYELAQRFFDGDEVELAASEVVLVQTLLALLYTPVVTGPVGLALDGKPMQ